MKRMQASTLPEFGVIGSCDSSERGDLESISDSRCGLTDGYVDPVGTQWQDKQENDNNVGMNVCCPTPPYLVDCIVFGFSGLYD